MRVLPKMTDIPSDLASFVETEAANALNLPGGTVDILADPELALIGLARVTEALIYDGFVSHAVKEAGCFEAWLLEQTHRENATGKVSRWVTEQVLLGRWQSEFQLLRRFGHTCNTLEHHERRLKRLPAESVETFFGVYDEYLADAMRGYDEKVQQNIEKG